MGQGDTSKSRRHRGRGAWGAQRIGLEAKYMTSESAPSETAAATIITIPSLIITKDRRGPLMAYVYRPKGPEPMSEQLFKVGF